MDTHSIDLQPISPDDRSRNLTLTRPSEDESLPHIGVGGDTCTLLLSGAATNRCFCLIDMHIPPGGGPNPHRHDFEETFSVLEGEIEVTFRGQKTVVSFDHKVGETLNIPTNVPHKFHNVSHQNVRLLCLCAPAGQEEFFAQIGVVLPTRTTPSPKLDDAGQAAFIAKSAALAPKCCTEPLQTTYV